LNSSTGWLIWKNSSPENRRRRSPAGDARPLDCEVNSQRQSSRWGPPAI